MNIINCSKIISLLFIFLPLIFSCNNSPDDGDKETGPGFQIEDMFSVSDYDGPGSENPEASELSSSNQRLTISAPEYDDFQADAWFTVSGSIATDTNGIPYFWLILLKVDGSQPDQNNWESTSCWLKGERGATANFSQRVWLRFGQGDYVAYIYEIAAIDENENGVISSWSYYGPFASMNITNSNAEDGRYLYPSTVVQSDDSVLFSAATRFTGSTDIIRDIHDWVVCYLYYDFDSLAVRKKQDALSVYLNETAVCEGYTSLYMAMLRAWKIPVRYIHGTANGGSHAWNSVFNGIEWKYVDTTWDDPVFTSSGHSNYPDGENLRYDYFWKDMSDWSETHVLEGEDSSRSIESVPAAIRFPGYPAGSY